MARKSKPRKTPEQIAAERLKARMQNLEAVSLPGEMAVLEVHADLELTRKGDVRASDGSNHPKRVDHDEARRLDAFAALQKGFVTGGYDAVRRLEKAMLRQHGEGDRGRNLDRVDATVLSDAEVILRRVDAGTEVAWVLKRTGGHCGWLLSELLRPTTQRPTWRAHVYYVTGEAHEHAQAAAVRMAVANLVTAYKLWEERSSIDKKPRRDAWGGTEKAA